MIAGFNEAMRRREHEMRTQINEMSSVVLAHEMKVGIPQGSICGPMRRELIAGFDEAMRRRELEMRTQINESSVVLAHEMKVGVP